MSTRRPSAPEAGRLPIPVGVVLAVIAAAAVMIVGESAGYARYSLAGFLLSGGIAAGAVHLASRDTVLSAIGSLLVVWVAGILYVAILAGMLADLIFDLSLAIVPVGLVIVGTLLASFGLLGSTVKDYGMGGVQKLLKRYYLGTLVFALAGTATVLLLSFDDLTFLSAEATDIDIESARESVMMAGETAFAESEFHLGFALVYFIVAGFGVVALRRLRRKIPTELFFTPHELDQRGLNPETRGSIRKGVTIGVVVYLLAAITATVHAEVVLDYPGLDQLTAIVAAIHRLDIFIVISVITVSAIGVNILVGLLDKLPAATNAGILITAVPPLAVLGSIVGTVMIDPKRAESFITVVIVDNTARVDRGSGTHELLLTDPLITLVGVLIVGLVLSGFAFTMPSVLSYQRVNDGSLSGVAAGSLGVILVVLAAAFLHTSPLVLFAGVGAVAVIWGIGEHAMVAAGELRSPDGELPTSFYRLPIVQAVVTTVIAVVGIGAAIGIHRLSQQVSTDPTTAMLVVGCAIVGLAAALFLLDG